MSPLRVTQSLLYGSSIRGMNKTLGDLMESNLQSSTQKRINRPSDDPSGTGRVISFRSKLNTLVRYQSNIDQASGWLSVADSTLAGSEGSVQNILTSIKTLDLQGSTGTVGEENREQISFALRGFFEQLINLANTQFDGYHIFAGHKTDKPAYTMGLGVDCIDDADSGASDINTARFHVEGSAKNTVIIQAVDPGTAAAVPPGSGSGGGTSVAAGSAEYIYSEDGGSTWKAATVTAGLPANTDDGSGPTQCVIQAGGVSVAISDENALVTTVDTANPHYNNNGTWLYVRPTAIYQGDDNDTQVSTVYNPPGSTNAGLGTGFPVAEGYFTRDVAVRIDSAAGGQITYSYSLDDGNNWTQTTAPAVPSGTPSIYHLPVPGGYLNMDAVPADTSQFIIHPHRADINFQISESSSITVNMVGKDIFGGFYNYPGDGIKNPVPVTGQPNLFEVVGKLISAAETNDQQGFQEGLDQITEVMKHVLTKAAVAGGREERLLATKAALTNQIYSEEEGLSAVEDIDVTELMTKIALQQVAYNSVLKSSSMIMQMSLVNFL
ncbi:MAG: flagellar hook-associated protein FlgL [Desulfovibrio sp.]|jgi:flagellar hook-associated protein 3 FlgL|nr:flagellar hook-associated protein FlgL [Desulfovibrio sp.]